jgi:hypothetical protein
LRPVLRAQVVIMADGQVTLGSQVVKPNVNKLRRVNDSVIGGFAGAQEALMVVPLLLPPTGCLINMQQRHALTMLPPYHQVPRQTQLHCLSDWRAG